MKRVAGVRTAVVMAVTAVLATACGPGLQSFSVGRSVAGKSYPITVVFDDAEGLPIGGHVELHDVTIGRVTSMDTHDFRAYVHLTISSKVKLPTGTKAQLALTTPLGEEYVDLIPPTAATTTVLAAGDTIGNNPGEDQTSRAPDVEDLFSAFSAILNGGGIDQIRTITTELNKALAGKAATGRALINNLNAVLAQLAQHTTEIDSTLASVAALAKEFNAQRGLIVRGLTELRPGIAALNSDTAAFTQLLTHLSRVGRTATSVLNQVQSTLVSDLQGLAPTLDTLASLRGKLGSTLVGLRQFALLLDRAIPGDFLNLTGSVDLK